MSWDLSSASGAGAGVEFVAGAGEAAGTGVEAAGTADVDSFSEDIIAWNPEI